MRLRERLADRAEELVRHPRRVRIRQFLFGDPLVGGAVGILSWGLARLVHFPNPPFDLVLMILVIVGVLTLSGLGTRRLEEPVGDLTNRGMTRVYGLPWVPFQLRTRLYWDWEPWRSSFIVTFMHVALDGISSTNVGLPMIVDSSLITGVVMGAVVALVRDLLSRDSWTNPLGP